MLRRIAFLLVTLLSVTVLQSRAQSSSTWIGLELGDPSSITLLFERGDGPDLEFLASWDLDERLFVNGHLLWFAIEADDMPLTMHYGPGAFVGFRDHNGSSDLIVGASFRLEGAYNWDRFSAYLALTPRLEVIEETQGHLGGAIGFRMRL